MFEKIAIIGFLALICFLLLAVVVEGVIQMIDKERRRREGKDE